MRLRWTVLAVGAMVAGSVTGASAQSQGWAITPYVGYSLPSGNLVEPNNASCCLTVDPSGGVIVGVNGELGLSKQFAVNAFISSTVGLSQGATWDYSLIGSGVYDFGMATNEFGATFIVRPLGRLPNGAPKVFFLEAGAALTQLRFSEIQDRTSNNPSPTWNSNGTSAIFGGGLTFRIGPRSTLVIFGRYSLALKEYTSDGLTDWNSIPPPDIAQKVNLITIGAGLRTGH